MTWLRLDVDLPDDPHLWSLAERLGVTEAAALGHAVRMMTFATKYTDDGDLSTFSPSAIARAAGWNGDPAAFRDAAIAAGWLVQDDGRLDVAGFDASQGPLIERRRRDAAQKREKRHTENATGTGRRHDVGTTSAGHPHDVGSYVTDVTDVTDVQPEPEDGPVPFSKILAAWNAQVPHAKMRSIAGKRREAIRARVAEYGIDGVLELIAKVAASPFLTGGGSGDALARARVRCGLGLRADEHREDPRGHLRQGVRASGPAARP